ncbi:putative monooxygenase [Exophiala viscosa]|uniref:putative monooxygenase n=1 Tax=Exophiala viscosa TaxID=2486360 RepID=UPI002195998E|nr:putative monooxygenase [Exophiala viscosa]
MVLSKIIIVGGGPSGLVLALLLANAGVIVEILEGSDKLDESPRASHYSWPALYELQRAGLLEEIRKRGFVATDGISWRKVDGTLLAKFSIDAIPPDYRLHALPLGRLCALLKERIDGNPNVEIKYLHKVIRIDQSDESARVFVDTPQGEQLLEADYIVGCDGANSQIRRSLFGDGEFPGRTWGVQIVATNVYYDIASHGWGQGAFIVDPVHWSMAAQIQPDGLLRVSYGEKVGLSREEYIARQPEKFRTILPGHPSPEQYKIVNLSPYKIHQRCAKSFRVGRFLLAADAAHLCNPFGGLGLTGGLVDVGNLFDCFIGIHKGFTDDSILDRYSEVRREKYFSIIDPVSSANLRRLIQDPDIAMKEDPFFTMAKDFENPEFCAGLAAGVNDIMHDFTKEYVKPR